jgi:hypothetical protein
MKAHLLSPTDAAACAVLGDDVAVDLDIDTLLTAMAGNDPVLRSAAEQALGAPLADADTVRHRQQVLTDCLDHPELPRRLFDLATAAIAADKKEWTIGDSPDTRLHRSVRVLTAFIPLLRDLRAIADRSAGTVRSPGFRTMFATLLAELDDVFFTDVDRHIQQLNFRGGLLVSTRLTGDYRSGRFTVRSPHEPTSWWRTLFPRRSPYAVVIPPRDDAGARALGEIRGRATAVVSVAVSESVTHMLNFFVALRDELAFYLGVLNLHGRLTDAGMPLCLPTLGDTETGLVARGLYDPGLLLRAAAPVVGNDVDASGRAGIVVTGANQGGKSTFLRSVGIAQLMAQAGMFVSADEFTTDVRSGLFTHFRREEDETLVSGKFDEELTRMSGVVDAVARGGLVLMNESFAATNESEGAEIGGTVVRALLDAGVAVVLVTHSFELAVRLRTDSGDRVLFLRAERRDDGQRTFCMLPGDPEPTSFGLDLYDRIISDRQRAER